MPTAAKHSTITKETAYPFGMLERSYSDSIYRFGFGGHEKIDEVFNIGGSVVDMGDRWLDVRLCKTPKTDIEAKKYPDISPYSYAANNPILFHDPNGKEVKAYGIEEQTLVLKTLSYAFGENHGFSFENNTLIHDGSIPKDMTPQQILMFKYFQETLVKSQTITTIKLNRNISVGTDGEGEVLIQGPVKEGAASTFYYPSSKKYRDNGKFKAPTLISSKEAVNEIIVTRSLLKDGINLNTKTGDKIFNPEHALLHEFAHAMVNVIMTEMGGVFNGIDFTKMSKQERSDWAIRYTNTLLQSKNYPLETGEKQHGRNKGEVPQEENVKPLSK